MGWALVVPEESEDTMAYMTSHSLVSQEKEELKSTQSLETHLPRLHRIAHARLNDQARAQDVVQDAVARVLARKQRGEEIENLGAYLVTTLVNLCRTPQRRFEPLDTIEEPGEPPAAPRRLVVDDVLSALAHLPPDQADLLRRLALGNAGYAELSAELGVAEGTVMSRISRARARLRTALNLPANGAVAELLPDEN